MITDVKFISIAVDCQQFKAGSDLVTLVSLPGDSSKLIPNFHLFFFLRNFAQLEGGKLMAMGLYKNLVTHLVMLEGEGLIETQDVAIAVVKAQEAATKKGKQLQELDKNEAENEAGREMLRRGDEEEKKKKSRRSGSVEEEWLVRINNRMEENEKKKEEVIFEDKVGMEKGEENSFSSSFLSLSSSSSNDSMPVLSDQSKEGPCLLLSSPPVLDVKTFTMIDIQLFYSFSSRLWKILLQ